MKLPPDTIIASEKISHYLLRHSEVDDKSGFLALAGYQQHHAERLERDIRSLLLLEAMPIETTQYVEKFSILGILTDPNGRQLRVRTIWGKVLTSGETRFITLYPDHT